MNVIIGVDPHKATHTAVALDGNEVEIGEVQVRANASQLKRLLAWAAPFEKRTWAVEGAGGCGYLLSQQLVAAGSPNCCQADQPRNSRQTRPSGSSHR